MTHLNELFCVILIISCAIVICDDAVGILIKFQDYFNKNKEKSDEINTANFIKVPCRPGYKRLGSKCRPIF